MRIAGTVAGNDAVGSLRRACQTGHGSASRRPRAADRRAAFGGLLPPQVARVAATSLTGATRVPFSPGQNDQERIKASKSGLSTSACVVSIPWG
jgi:hypothetical protein